MLDYVVNNLDVNQYGGLRGLSTTHALVDMVHTWLLTAEERKASHVVLLDYRKAFDHVDHTVLVTKCKSYNLPNFIIGWLCFTCINSPSHKLHHLQPQPKSNRYTLRNSSKLPVQKTNTNRVKNSLIPYGVFH